VEDYNDTKSVVNFVDCPWLCVSGFGAHIKSTRTTLIIQKKNSVEELPLGSVKNLLIIGGHTINSATIAHLAHNGTFVSFFESNGTPVGIIRPFGDKSDNETRKAQQGISRHRFASEMARASLKSRLVAIGNEQTKTGIDLYYEGEMQFLHKSLEEIDYLIKLDEIERLNRLVTDMYYEIMARSIPSELGYRRRTTVRQSDPVNALLSFGYSLLFGNCCIPVVGERLDPDFGITSVGPGSLIRDLIEPLKASMIDTVVFSFARESLQSSGYEICQDRCIVSDPFIAGLTRLFQTTLDDNKIVGQVTNFKEAILNNRDIRLLY
jgi:CRISPR-associated protein Cas1